MEKFKVSLKKRLALMMMLNGAAVIFMVLTGIYGNMIASTNADTADMIHGFQAGIFAGMQFLMIKFITKYRKALNNEDELRKIYIEEKDERTKLIKDKIGGVGFNFSLGIIATASVISGFFNQIVFITLSATLIFMALIKGFLKVYYKNKF